MQFKKKDNNMANFKIIIKFHMDSFKNIYRIVQKQKA